MYDSFMIIEQKNKDQIKVQIFKALADESRLEIIRILRDQKTELSCGEVGEKINITKSTASYHFKTLREAGLTSTRKETRNKYVKLNLDTFEKYLPGFLDSL
ncbi:ArsR family transcriptional regulator [Niallia circulans]|jgi:DNA-binding transcriptional ArsR family regulator|uniref:Transcriptional regulator n=1 Tax=Niallia circulans TaxID=1397 RepID=A0A268F5V8_NIACI|nr:metalloregulator ArsR/SmtB family transcription factor [Niallia circulans]AYV66971.1 ArsR family transcriptional regulator [Niallia circulans]AYV70167.1 ArsR family transcriptional regulator [Niallia circulans]PAD80734.1 transcriptional regulator [Niallia circulans]